MCRIQRDGPPLSSDIILIYVQDTERWTPLSPDIILIYVQDTERWTPLSPDTLSAPELETLVSKIKLRTAEVNRQKHVYYCIITPLDGE